MPDIFSPPNVGYPVKRERLNQTIVKAAPSGQRWRSPVRSYPTLRWTLPFEALTTLGSYQGLSAQTQQYLEGFFVDQIGPFNEWLFQDVYTPDYQLSAAQIGLGDGVSTNFTVCRAWRNTHEPVGYVRSADVSSVTVAGASTGAWSITSPNILTLSTAPAIGASVAISCSYFWRCTFTEDVAEFEEFMQQLFETRALRFESLPSLTAPTNIT